jgi:hypothetical protein
MTPAPRAAFAAGGHPSTGICETETIPMESTPVTENRPMPRAKAWGILGLTFFTLWLFAIVVGPWLQHHIYSMDDIVQVIEENNIDSGAYYYTEIKGAYTGEKYLRQSLEMSTTDEFGLTWPFISGIVTCLVMLCVGFKYLPE